MRSLEEGCPPAKSRRLAMREDGEETCRRDEERTGALPVGPWPDCSVGTRAGGAQAGAGSIVLPVERLRVGAIGRPAEGRGGCTA